MDTSGIKELDDAAIESFNDAGPFPNPPKGLVVDGKVTIEWGFVVKS
jgi:outer membrane biosynthesis protein TonB